MTTTLLAFTSLTLLLAIAAFLRERRQRRALQLLLKRLLATGNRHAKEDPHCAVALRATTGQRV